MKTATFNYTHKSEVYSSLAEFVYYNDQTHELALELVNESYGPTASVIYDQVPFHIYEALVDVDNSVGRIYNQFVKNVYTNASDGTVYDVNYCHLAPEVEDVTKSVTLNVRDDDNVQNATMSIVDALSNRDVKEIVIRFV